MLHTKSQGYQPSGSGEYFKVFFYHIWVWWPSWSCDQDHLNKLLFPHPKKSPYEMCSIGPPVSEEMFENVYRQRDDRRTIDEV